MRFIPPRPSMGPMRGKDSIVRKVRNASRCNDRNYEGSLDLVQVTVM